MLRWPCTALAVQLQSGIFTARHRVSDLNLPPDWTASAFRFVCIMCECANRPVCTPKPNFVRKRTQKFEEGMDGSSWSLELKLSWDLLRYCCVFTRMPNALLLSCRALHLRHFFHECWFSGAFYCQCLVAAAWTNPSPWAIVSFLTIL